MKVELFISDKSQSRQIRLFVAGLDKIGQKKSENGQSCSFSFHQDGSYLEPGVIGAVRAGRPHCLGKGSVTLWDEVGRSRRPVSLNQRGGGAFEARTWSAEWAAGQRRRRRRGAVN